MQTWRMPEKSTLFTHIIILLSYEGGGGGVRGTIIFTSIYYIQKRDVRIIKSASYLAHTQPIFHA